MLGSPGRNEVTADQPSSRNKIARVVVPRRLEAEEKARLAKIEADERERLAKIEAEKKAQLTKLENEKLDKDKQILLNI